jgi:hypothetical protein
VGDVLVWGEDAGRAVAIIGYVDPERPSGRGLLEPITTFDQCTRYTSRARQGNPDTTLQAMLNAHAHWPADRDRARAWLQARWPVGG